jgi:hypothetical protein
VCVQNVASKSPPKADASRANLRDACWQKLSNASDKRRKVTPRVRAVWLRISVELSERERRALVSKGPRVIILFQKQTNTLRCSSSPPRSCYTPRGGGRKGVARVMVRWAFKVHRREAGVQKRQRWKGRRDKTTTHPVSETYNSLRRKRVPPNKIKSWRLMFKTHNAQASLLRRNRCNHPLFLGHLSRLWWTDVPEKK